MVVLWLPRTGVGDTRFGSMRDTTWPRVALRPKTPRHAVGAPCLAGTGAPPGERPGAGCIALLLMGIVGCTTVTDGTAMPDTNVAPAYRSSVSRVGVISAATNMTGKS